MKIGNVPINVLIIGKLQANRRQGSIATGLWNYVSENPKLV
jgi:hypothetical protein